MCQRPCHDVSEVGHWPESVAPFHRRGLRRSREISRGYSGVGSVRGRKYRLNNNNLSYRRKCRGQASGGRKIGGGTGRRPAVEAGTPQTAGAVLLRFSGESRKVNPEDSRGRILKFGQTAVLTTDSHNTLVIKLK